jgi:hypothetical protein
MSNAGRPRTGFKPCQHCGSTDRDSNGQCHCRNVAYREARKAALAKTQKPKQNKKKAQPKPQPPITVPKKAKGLKVVHTTTEPEPVKTEPTPKPTPERYILTVDGFEETPYARKDAAIKNGVRSGMEWTVTYKGKIVATSEV